MSPPPKDAGLSMPQYKDTEHIHKHRQPSLQPHFHMHSYQHSHIHRHMP